MLKSRIFISIGLMVFFVSSPLNANEGKYAEYYIKKAQEAENDHKFEEAVSLYKKAIENNPKILEVYKKVGYIYHYELGEIEKAIEMYLSGLRLEPKEYGLNLSVMHAFFRNSDLEKGINYYKVLSTIRKRGQRFSFPREIVEVITKEKDQEEVIAFCIKYLKINPTDIVLREKLVDIYMKERKYGLAKKQCEAMLEHGYMDGAVYFRLAVCDYYAENYKESLENFMKAKQLGEDIPDYYIDMVKNKLN